ncbi:MAG: hypothetical protein ACKOW2_06955, partial [Sphingobacteriaceae bacterium]
IMIEKELNQLIDKVEPQKEDIIGVYINANGSHILFTRGFQKRIICALVKAMETDKAFCIDIQAALLICISGKDRSRLLNSAEVDNESSTLAAEILETLSNITQKCAPTGNGQKIDFKDVK